MRRFLFTITILASLSLVKAQTQQPFSVGIGGGPNMFFGSVSDGERVGFTGYIEAIYKINNNFSTSLSFSNNQLQASRYVDNLTSYYFESSVNNIDLHFEMDVLQLSQLVPASFPIKVIFDVGAGFSFFDEGLYYGNYVNDNPSYPDISEGDLSYVYKDSHGKGTAGKLHVGPTVSYEITPEFTVTSSILAHYYFTSDIDGYAHYANQPEKPSKNDVFYAWTFGVRYNLRNIKFNNDDDDDKPLGYRGRFFGKKTTEESINENQYEAQPQDDPERRWNGKKKKNSNEKPTTTERWVGKKNKDKRSNSAPLKSF